MVLKWQYGHIDNVKGNFDFNCEEKSIVKAFVTPEGAGGLV